MKKQTKHFVFKYSATIHQMKYYFLGAELVGAEIVRGQVGKGPSLLRAEVGVVVRGCPGIVDIENRETNK